MYTLLLHSYFIGLLQLCELYYRFMVFIEFGRTLIDKSRVYNNNKNHAALINKEICNKAC